MYKAGGDTYFPVSIGVNVAGKPQDLKAKWLLPTESKLDETKGSLEDPLHESARVHRRSHEVEHDH
jgi:hypothetical protein